MPPPTPPHIPPHTHPQANPGAVDLSVIAPAHNEQENLEPLIEEIDSTLRQLALTYEIIIVDDGSTDNTALILQDLLQKYPEMQAIQMNDTPVDCGNGQSAAFYAGLRESQGEFIVFLDADLQNDPADIPHLLQRQNETGADMVQGDRSHARQDHFIRRISSVVGRLFRRWLLQDSIRDTGCSLRLMKREVALALPLRFRGMHRFIPVTARQLGYRVVEMPVNHRERSAGEAKYGIWNRALPGLIDCFAVRWMRNRRRPVTYVILEKMQTADSTNPSEETLTKENAV